MLDKKEKKIRSTIFCVPHYLQFFFNCYTSDHGSPHFSFINIYDCLRPYHIETLEFVRLPKLTNIEPGHSCDTWRITASVIYGTFLGNRRFREFSCLYKQKVSIIGGVSEVTGRKIYLNMWGYSSGERYLVWFSTSVCTVLKFP